MDILNYFTVAVTNQTVAKPAESISEPLERMNKSTRESGFIFVQFSYSIFPSCFYRSSETMFMLPKVLVISIVEFRIFIRLFDDCGKLLTVNCTLSHLGKRWIQVIALDTPKDCLRCFLCITVVSPALNFSNLVTRQ